jgi:hypothetical protein
VTLHSAIFMTVLNGVPVYRDGRLAEPPAGRALEFAPL